MCKCALECNESPESTEPSWIQDTADFMTNFAALLHHESVLWIWQVSVFPETRRRRLPSQAQWMDLDLRKVHGGGGNLLSTAGPFCSKTEKYKTLMKSILNHRIQDHIS